MNADPQKPAAEQPADNRMNSTALHLLTMALRTAPAPAADPADRRAVGLAPTAQPMGCAHALAAAERDRQRATHASAYKPNELDLLAVQRAMVWVIWADGFGIGVTMDEVAALQSPDRKNHPAAARSIVRRLADLIEAPDADAGLVSQSHLMPAGVAG